MSIVLVGSTSGSVTLQEPAVAGTTVLTLPAVTGTVLTTTSPKAGNVIQVVSTTKTDTFSASLARGAVSGDAITASITPTSSSSKILVLFNGSFGNSNTAPIYILLYKGGSVVSGATGDAAGNRLRSSAASFISSTSNLANINLNYLDSPATTSSTTYSIRIGHGSGETRTLYLNRSDSDGDFDYITRTASFLTLMEIAA